VIASNHSRRGGLGPSLPLLPELGGQGADLSEVAPRDVLMTTPHLRGRLTGEKLILTGMKAGCTLTSTLSPNPTYAPLSSQMS
jgi:hypothetical protein